MNKAYTYTYTYINAWNAARNVAISARRQQRVLGK